MVVEIEVAYCLPERQFLQRLSVPEGTTVRAALHLSRLSETFPQADLNAPVGIFGAVVADDTVVCEHDRVELYRPLQIDPKESRRERVRKNRERHQNQSKTA